MSTPFLSKAILGTTLLFATSLAQPSPLWLEPSKQWYGIDGNWSSISLSVGEPAQRVDVSVSTSLSEIWLVEANACSSNDTDCKAKRGGVYDASKSEGRQPLGAWRLGIEYLGLGGNGDYAMETVAAFDRVRNEARPIKQLVAGINDTDYYTGFFGLGIDHAKLKDVVAEGPLTELNRNEVIGARGYGYTAGAYYAGGGTPLSLTLGGYDENRFIPHNTLFNLNESTRQPEVLIESITTSVADLEKAPTEWPAASVVLSSSNESTTALLDSTTPFLWLPSSTCDKFARAFDLAWNETLGLYMFPDDDSIEKFRSSPNLAVTFKLSNANSPGGSEEPVDNQAEVSIDISANAFIHYLRYPFSGLEDAEAEVPYFPLRRVNDGGKIIIGRAFMQEAYLITNYEGGTFSVHQAAFPDDPYENTSIQPISADNSVKFGTRADSGKINGLSNGQLAGIVIGSSLLGVAATMMVWWIWQRRKNQDAPKDTAESFAPPDTPNRESGGLLSTISKHLTWSNASRDDTRSPFTPSPYPTQYGNTPSHDYRTLSPAVELYDARRDGALQYNPPEDTTGYEIARMGLDPLPIEHGYDQPMHEYTDDNYTTNPMASPGRPSTDMGLYNMYPGSPSPGEFSDGSNSPTSPGLHPHGDWTHAMTHYPSSQPLVNTQFVDRSNSTLSSNNTEPYAYSPAALRSVSSRGSLVPPSPPVQREPIDGSRVICLGPLPDNVQLPYPSSMPPPPPPAQLPYSAMFEPPPIPPSVNYRRNRVSTAETLGSNYTVEEESRGRIDGFDIVHIPHIPERRYSWE